VSRKDVYVLGLGLGLGTQGLNQHRTEDNAELIAHHQLIRPALRLDKHVPISFSAPTSKGNVFSAESAPFPIFLSNFPAFSSQKGSQRDQGGGASTLRQVLQPID